MPDVTKQLSARLVEKCIDYANENGYSAIIEGTWRDDSVALDTAREARRSACREARSYIMVIMRSYSKAYMFLFVLIRYHMLYVYN